MSDPADEPVGPRPDPPAERVGTPSNVADGLIAAIALVHGMSIATRDISDFDVTGAPLVNPWDFTMPGSS